AGQTSGGAAGDVPIWSALGFFISAQYEKAERDGSDYEAGYDSDGNTITAGLDYRFNEKLVVGAALGYTQNELDYNLQGGSLDSEIFSFILFSSYTWERLSLETQLGYAGTEFDSIRRVVNGEAEAAANATMEGGTGGEQILREAQLHGEWRRNALSVYPFVRFDYPRNEADGSGEPGGPGLPRISGSQSTDQWT